jgi:thiosulfate reductase cytochrome b subunit
MEQVISSGQEAKHGGVIHPAWLRIMHWLNALAVLILVGSGWAIYNASPLFGFEFPREMTLGGWLAGGIMWHFAAMWLLGINGVLYLLFNVFSGRLVRRFFPLSLGALFADIGSALRGHLSHADLRRYNMVQKVSYLFVMLVSVVLVLSGLVLMQSVQFPLLRDLLGGYDTARYIHFFAMAGLVGFVIVHVAMALLVPRSLHAMVCGR